MLMSNFILSSYYVRISLRLNKKRAKEKKNAMCPTNIKVAFVSAAKSTGSSKNNLQDRI